MCHTHASKYRKNAFNKQKLGSFYWLEMTSFDISMLLIGEIVNARSDANKGTRIEDKKSKADEVLSLST